MRVTFECEGAPRDEVEAELIGFQLVHITLTRACE
jgi:hypothetical protein